MKKPKYTPPPPQQFKDGKLKHRDGKFFATGLWTKYGDEIYIECPITRQQYEDLASGVCYEVMWIERGEDYYATDHITKKGKVCIYMTRENWMTWLFRHTWKDV